MSKFTSILSAAALFAAAATPFLPSQASALPILQPGAIADASLPVEKAGYFYGGRDYCFYPNGWRGPGFYLCGFPYRRGFFFAPGFFHGRGGYGRGGFGHGGGGFGHGGGGFGHGGFGGGHMGGGHMGGGHMGGGHMGGGHGGGGHGGGGHGGGGHH